MKESKEHISKEWKLIMTPSQEDSDTVIKNLIGGIALKEIEYLENRLYEESTPTMKAKDQ